ncbi:hypothetical protein AHAS_Ahas12G0086700 [Arachis hypogaea]
MLAALVERCHIFCLLGTTLFVGKSTAYLHAKYLPLLQNFDQIGNYIWGSAYLANLYKSLCRASRYNCKEMDGPLDLLFVWVWERMPRLASIPRHQLAPAEIPVARRWSHHPWARKWMAKTHANIRHAINIMEDPPQYPPQQPPPYAMFQPFPYHGPQPSHGQSSHHRLHHSHQFYHRSHHSHHSHHSQHSHLGFRLADIPLFSPSQPSLGDYDIICRFLDSGGLSLDDAYIPAIPSQQSSQLYRASVDGLSHRHHPPATPDSRASVCIKSHIQIDRGRTNASQQAPIGQDLN